MFVALVFEFLDTSIAIFCNSNDIITSSNKNAEYDAQSCAIIGLISQQFQEWGHPLNPPVHVYIWVFLEMGDHQNHVSQYQSGLIWDLGVPP